MQTNESGPPSTAQKNQSEAAGGSLLDRAMSALLLLTIALDTNPPHEKLLKEARRRAEKLLAENMD